ncbi:MAG: GNAT family N-acetyltransferase [Planctomycetales bacterium]
MSHDLDFRTELRPGDRDAVREIVASTGFFRPEEIDVAVELVDERLARGPASGYHFVFAELDGETAGYACYGPIACTLSSYDLYWIAVRQAARGRGIGRRILQQTESRVRAAGGTRLYIETSGRADYASTQAFYLRCGYRLEATLADFYAPGDDRLTYVRALPETGEV